MRQLLVIDDEAHVARVIQVAFERDGWRVSSAFQLEDALHEIRTSRFDVIFLDVKLPDGSGLDFLKKLREGEDAIETPVIVLSGAEFAGVRQTVKDLGGYYVAKPFSPSKLKTMVNDILGRTDQNI